MGASFINLGIIALLGWLLWRATRPRPVFRIRIEGGRPVIQHGTATPAFLDAVEQLCAQHGLAGGEIAGTAGDSGQISLRFSRRIPAGARQQLRNWWAEFGWIGPPNHPPPPRRRRIATR